MRVYRMENTSGNGPFTGGGRSAWSRCEECDIGPMCEIPDPYSDGIKVRSESRFAWTEEGYRKYVCEHRLDMLHREGYKVDILHMDASVVQVGHSGVQVEFPQVK